jgi:hypothetical protein
MLEVVEGLQREVDHVMARVAVEPRDKRNATGVVFEASVIEAGGAGRRRRPRGGRAAHEIKNTGTRAEKGAELERSKVRL